MPGLKLPILLILLPRLSAITLVTAGEDICDGDCDGDRGDVMQVSPVPSIHMETLKVKRKDVDVYVYDDYCPPTAL